MSCISIKPYSRNFRQEKNFLSCVIEHNYYYYGDLYHIGEILFHHLKYFYNTTVAGLDKFLSSKKF